MIPRTPKSNPVPSTTLRALTGSNRPNGSYKEIDGVATALVRLNHLRLEISADLLNSRSRIIEAHELFIGNPVLDNAPAAIFQFAVRIAEAQFKLGRDTEAAHLFNVIKKGVTQLRNQEFGTAILSGAIKICRRNDMFELAMQLTESLADPARQVEAHLQTAELARMSEQSAAAIRCLTQYVYPAIDRLENKAEKVAQLLATAELSLKLELRVEAKVLVYNIFDMISSMDYANLEAAAILLARLDLTEDAVHLLTDSWFRESFTEDPRYRSEQDIRQNIINQRFPRFASFLRSAKP